MQKPRESIAARFEIIASYTYAAWLNFDAQAAARGLNESFRQVFNHCPGCTRRYSAFASTPLPQAEVDVVSYESRSPWMNPAKTTANRIV